MEDLNEGNRGADGSRTEGSSQEESEQRSSLVVSMEVEEEGSHELPSIESDSFLKSELFRIIANQDKAIAILRRELEGGRSGDTRDYSPSMRKRDRVIDDSESSQYEHPYYEEPSGEMTPPRRPNVWRAHAELAVSGLGEHNLWAPRRQIRSFGVRQPLAQSVLMEPSGTTLPPLSSYDEVTDPEDHLNS
ncbi:unnamed protein product [Linum trigynum]|uniref:Uncharacterized protein n=1 Tax=Linum trigynum TaxID=586398 RepID=A0AAV2CTJ2_9ROSI